jgi:hypothetical protein
MSLWVLHLDTRSAVSRFFGNSGSPGAALLALALFLHGEALAQLTTGTVEGTVHTVDGRAFEDVAITISGAGLRTAVRTGRNGGFVATLPYGSYLLSVELRQGISVFVAPAQTTRVDLVIDAAGALHSAPVLSAAPGIWTASVNTQEYPEAFSLQGLLLSREPLSVTEPLNFTGLGDNRLALESQRAFSWTDTQYKLQGMDATDSWQPGLPVILPDVQSLEGVTVRSGFAQITSSSPGTEVSVFLGEQRVSTSDLRSWHGTISTGNTGATLSSTNLPAPASRGSVQQSDEFRWFTRDRIGIGGPVTKWADLFASASGQWASQTEPLSAPGTDQGSRLLFANVRGRVRAGARDRFDALYSGSRIDLSDGGVPVGLEALTGNRMMPAFNLPGGFSGQPETDHFDFVQVGWSHLLSPALSAGVIELRYGYSTAHLDTRSSPDGQSITELLGGQVTGAPPLANLAIRTRHEFRADWQAAGFRVLAASHRIVAGGGWQTAQPRNRFTTPSGINLITAGEVPAFVVEFNTPLDSRERVRSFSGYLADHVTLTRSITVDVGIFADFSRGSLPNQSSPAGQFAPRRLFAAQPDLIAWDNVSPRAGFAWQVPHSGGLVIRGTYFRLYAPLAGRYLDFGNPNGLGGSVYQWIAPNSSTPFQSVDPIRRPGAVLVRFGGPYSSISSDLRRPFSDEFDVGAEYRLAARSTAGVHLFRRDEKNRIAVIDTGVPARAFTPVSILDSGPDGIPGTFDDQRLTVYAQDPATFGQDRYLLTNPAGLRMLNTGLAASIDTEWRGLTFRTSFVAERSYGPTNPGNGAYENDPGQIGALFLDPNTTINEAGRSFVDRAYIGKIQSAYRLPSTWGGIEVASVADYMDGLTFARQLLVTGLPQGPFLIDTTVRGSPNGGNRAQHVVNWNLRLSRDFGAGEGKLTLSADVLNVTNSAHRLQENDLSGPSFNLRLPVAIQPPRFLRIGFRYAF